MRPIHIGAGFGALAAVVLGTGWWVLNQPDVTEYPSKAANARLDVLQQDALVSEVGTYLGLAPAVSRLQCRDTPDGREAPTFEAVFRGSRPDLRAEQVTALAKAAGWQTVFTNQPGTSAYSVQLRKSFGTWESNTVVTVTEAEVALGLDATADGSCP